MTKHSPPPLAGLNWSRASDASSKEQSVGKMWPWFAVAMLYAAACAFLALRQGFASKYLLADDVREHVFWMFRYLDPGLFPNDPIADYFESLAPKGDAFLYWSLVKLGIDPLLASKCIPSVLSLIATGYFFGLVRRVFHSRAAATLGAILFAQCLWLNSDLASATPRAFFYPFFAAFLYYQVRGATLGVLIAIGLQALFFPPAALLSLGVLALDCLRWNKGPRLALAKDYHFYLLLGAALALTILCLWPYLRQVGEFGPLVTYDQAKRMPEFGPDGRVPFFFPTWWGYWVGGNAGIHNLPTRPPWFLLALLWPVLRFFPKRFPWLNAVPRGARPVSQMIGSALLLFIIAHLFLFRLYLPNRYTEAMMRMVMILLATGVIMALVDAALFWAKKQSVSGTYTTAVTLLRPALLLGLVIMLSYPLLLPSFPTAGYVLGTDPDLYHFFERQPATIHIASLSDEANNLPTFCRRSIIIGAECAVPFNPGYYFPLRDRGLEIARAQYSADPAILRKCIRDQQIDFWLLDLSAYARDYPQKSRLLRQLRLSASDKSLGLAQGAAPLLERPPPGSIAFEDARFIVLDAHQLFAVP